MTTEKIKGILENPKGRRLSESQKLRLCAIAAVYLSKVKTARKIAGYADSRGIDIDLMAYRFAIGACKNVIKTGAAYNYDDAIQIIENRQERIKSANPKKVAPIYGEIYQQMIERNRRLEPDQMVESASMPKNLRQHYRQYYNRLSNVGRAVVRDVVKCGGDVDFNKPLSRAFGRKLQRLYDSYPYKTAVKIRDFIHNLLTYL